MADEPTLKIVETSALSNVNEYDDEHLLWSDEELDDVTNAYSNEMSFNAYSSASTSVQKHVWLLDTGATHHMCNDITSFRTLNKWFAQVGFCGEETDGKVLGCGDVLLRLHSSTNGVPNCAKSSSVTEYSDIEENVVDERNGNRLVNRGSASPSVRISQKVPALRLKKLTASKTLHNKHIYDV
ncbi:hypothetical protein V1525DRAFT_421950 [Lipomyces kononenkoae]|uniref:Uncharacterized protein n=1 Tax=Lipomyces kononenkoae TaxID=34357 RepID=A0ACC3SUH0_LIPKO